MGTEFIIGTIITIIFGIIPIIQSYKKASTRLIFVVDEFINLYADITTTISEMEVTYKGEKVNDKLYLFKAYIFCFGDKDITKEQISKKLYIELKNDSKWKDCKIIDKTDGLDVAIEQTESKVTFDFDLLKGGDFFCFQSLCEIKDKSLLNGKILSINHRIANISGVRSLNSKEDIVPMYVIIMAWLGTIVASYLMLWPTFTIQSYEDSNFRERLYLNGKEYKIDSIVSPFKKRIDSINAKQQNDRNNVRSMYDKITMYYNKRLSNNEYNSFMKISNKIDRLNEVIGKRENVVIMLGKRIESINKDFAKKDSIYKIMSEKYTYGYFLVQNETTPIAIDSKHSIGYILVKRENAYYAGIGILGVLILCIGSGLLTNRYFKYKSILDKISSVTRNGESIKY